jgi:hypothetical protein
MFQIARDSRAVHFVHEVGPADFFLVRFEFGASHRGTETEKRAA